MKRLQNGDYALFDDRLDPRQRLPFRNRRQPSVEEGIGIAERNVSLAWHNAGIVAQRMGRVVNFIIPKRREV